MKLKSWISHDSQNRIVNEKHNPEKCPIYETVRSRKYRSVQYVESNGRRPWFGSRYEKNVIFLIFFCLKSFRTRIKLDEIISAANNNGPFSVPFHHCINCIKENRQFNSQFATSWFKFIYNLAKHDTGAC